MTTSLAATTRRAARRAAARAVCRTRLAAEAGMTTAEYAVGTLAACTFAIVLLAVVRSGQVKAGLAGVILDALGIR